MPRRLSFAPAAILLPLVTACVHDYPGLPAPVVAPAPEHRFVIDLPDAPPPPPPPQLAMPFPPARLPLDQAAAVLKDDPMALRFLAVRALAEQGLVPLSEVAARKEANMGALLPLTAATRPSTDSDLPIPPIPAILGRFRKLDGAKGTPSAERQFLLDQLLEAQPAQRVVMAPHDRVAGRMVLDRLGRLEDSGLITADERAREAVAVETLMATLPEVLVEEEPEPPPTAKPARRSGTGASARRMSGGVSGKLEVVPSPGSFEPPRISAEFAGKAGVHLLSMAAAAYGDKAWEALTNQFKQELAGLSFAVQKADLGELGVTYRLVAGPMDAAAAERLCGVLRQKGQACMPTPFPQ